MAIMLNQIIMTAVFLFLIKKLKTPILGGSGCACCGTVFSGYLFNELKNKKYNKILLVATGALMNSTSSQQGESIPRYCSCCCNREYVLGKKGL